MSKSNNFYVYIYLNPLKQYEPFYVGKGSKIRAYNHLKENLYNRHFNFTIKKIQRETNNNPIIIIYEKNLSENEAFNIEKELIKIIGRRDLKTGSLCNLTEGGDGSSGRIHTEKTKRKMSEKKKGWKPSLEWINKKKEKQTGKTNSFYGKHHTEETITKLKSYKRTDETKEKIKIARAKQNMKGKANGKYIYEITYQNNVIKNIKCLKTFCLKNNLVYHKAKYYINKNKLYNGYEIKRFNIPTGK